MRKAILGMLLGGSAACREPTQITLEITTDVPCDKLSDVAITTGPTTAGVEGSAITLLTSKCDAATGRIGSLVVVPSGSVDDAVAIKVTGRVMQKGDATTGPCVAPYGPSCIVTRRALKYVPHTRLSLPMSLSRSCLGLPCAPDETCDRGVCRPVGECGAAGCANQDGGVPPVTVAGCGDMRGLQPGAQWPMLGYCPTRLGRSPFNGPQTTGPLIETHATNNGPLTSPVIDADGTVYVAGDDTLFALNPDLTPKWQQRISGPTHLEVADTAPVIAKDGTVWIGSAMHDLWAVNASGAKAFAVDFFLGPPLIEPNGDLVFPTGAGEGLRWIDGTGAKVFDLAVQPPSLHTAAARGWDGSLYLGTRSQNLVTVGPNRTYSLGDVGKSNDNFETPLVHPSGLVLAEISGPTMELGAFDASGKYLWSAELPGVLNLANGSAVDADGVVYASTSEGISSVDVGTHLVIESYTLDTALEATRTPTLGADGKVYVAKGPTLYALDPKGSSVAPLFTVPTISSLLFESSPAIGKNGWLYVTDKDGVVYGIHDP